MREKRSGGRLFLPLHFAVSPACSFVSVVCCLYIVFRTRPPHLSHRLEQTEPPYQVFDLSDAAPLGISLGSFAIRCPNPPSQLGLSDRFGSSFGPENLPIPHTPSLHLLVTSRAVSVIPFFLGSYTAARMRIEHDYRTAPKGYSTRHTISKNKC